MFNFYSDNNAFPNGRKTDDINPFYNKNDPFEKANYRAIKILPILSKTLKRLYD